MPAQMLLEECVQVGIGIIAGVIPLRHSGNPASKERRLIGLALAFGPHGSLFDKLITAMSK